MKVYSYSPVTGEYVGETTADESPLEPGKYLVPAYAVEAAPPAARDGEAAVWGMNMWHVVEDHRAAKGYVDGKEMEIKDLGPLPDGWSDTLPPPPPPTLEEAKSAKLEEISAAYKQYDTAGMVMTSFGWPVQIGQEHCTKLDGAIRFAEMTGHTEIYITDADNVTHYNIPLADAKKVLIEQMAAAMGAHAKKQQLRAAAGAAVTVAEVQAIQW